MMAESNREQLWACPVCGREFANLNQTHSCGGPALSAVLAGHGERVVSLYRAIESAVRDAGPFRVHPQKTRIAFISRMTFASVTLAKSWVDLGFIVPSPLDNVRIRRIELYGPTSFRHLVRIAEVHEVDDDLRGWLAVALRRGEQETLGPRAHVHPVVGRSLEILVVTWKAEVSRYRGALAVGVPRWAAQAFDAHRSVNVRIGRTHHQGLLTSTGDGDRVTFDNGGLLGGGLREGDRVDATMTAFG